VTIILESAVTYANEVFAFLTNYGQYTTFIWNFKELKEKKKDYYPNYLYFILKILELRGYICMNKDSILIIKRDFVFKGRHLDEFDWMFISLLNVMFRRRILFSLFY